MFWHDRLVSSHGTVHGYWKYLSDRGRAKQPELNGFQIPSWAFRLRRFLSGRCRAGGPGNAPRRIQLNNWSPATSIILFRSFQFVFYLRLVFSVCQRRTIVSPCVLLWSRSIPWLFDYLESVGPGHHLWFRWCPLTCYLTFYWLYVFYFYFKRRIILHKTVVITLMSP